MTETNSSRRELGLLLLSLFVWLIIGPPLALVLHRFPLFKSELGTFVVMFIPYVLLFATLLLGTRLLCHKSILTIIGKTKRQASYLGAVALLYLGITVLFTFLGATTIEKTSSTTQEKLLFLFPILLLIPMQTFSEEMIFRALPARILYGEELPKGRKMIPLAIGSGILFLVPHLANPEVLQSGTATFSILYYFLWGTMAMGLGLYASSFWVSITMHTVNNLFVALVVNYEHSAMPTKAFFINRGATSSLKQFLIMLLLFASETVLTYVYLRRTKKES